MQSSGEQALTQSTREQTFSDFLVREAGHVNLTDVTVNLLIAGTLAFLLGVLYIHYGRSASDRRGFAAQFVLVTMTTCLIIVVVKTSLALSLGLVGALSIVRFRSAVREHEELAFLFLAIALGLCMGADQVGLALIGFALIAIYISVRGMVTSKVQHENVYVRIHGPLSGEDQLQTIANVLSRCCKTVKLKRCDLTDSDFEAAFQVEFRMLRDLTKAQAEIKSQISPSVISIIHGEGIA